jgi:hypothetical protein
MTVTPDTPTMVTVPPVATFPTDHGDAYLFAPAINARHAPHGLISVDGQVMRLVEVESVALTMLSMILSHPESKGLESAVPAPPGTVPVFVQVANERVAQVEKWGDQHHHDFDQWADRTLPPAHVCQRTVERKAAEGALTWWDILREELAEARDAQAAGDPDAFQTELIQAAAVLIAWAEDVASRRPADA